MTMKNYHIYVFSQDSCPPCQRLKDHVKTLTEDEQAELDFVPLKTASGQRVPRLRRSLRWNYHRLLSLLTKPKVVSTTEKQGMSIVTLRKSLLKSR